MANLKEKIKFETMKLRQSNSPSALKQVIPKHRKTIFTSLALHEESNHKGSLPEISPHVEARRYEVNPPIRFQSSLSKLTTKSPSTSSFAKQFTANKLVYDKLLKQREGATASQDYLD